jgi:hypothetical protein
MNQHQHQHQYRQSQHGEQKSQPNWVPKGSLAPLTSAPGTPIKTEFAAAVKPKHKRKGRKEREKEREAKRAAEEAAAQHV